MKKWIGGAIATVALVGAAHAHEIIHGGHAHQHGAECEDQAVAHDGHVDYLHDGHLHSPHGDHADEHRIAESAVNPTAEKIVAKIDHGSHEHAANGTAHAHPSIQHGNHFDNIHEGRLHFHHGDHVDDHGPVALLAD